MKMMRRPSGSTPTIHQPCNCAPGLLESEPVSGLLVVFALFFFEISLTRNHLTSILSRKKDDFRESFGDMEEKIDDRNAYNADVREREKVSD